MNSEDAFKRQFVAAWLANVAVQRNFINRKIWPIRRALRLADLAYEDLVRVEDSIEAHEVGDEGGAAR